MNLKKHISFEDIENHPNPNPIQKIKPPTKSMNFGKSIKMKAQMLHDHQILKEHINGAIQPVNTQQTTPQSKHLKKRASFDENDFMFKSKIVRFEDEESGQDILSLQHSRNKQNRNPSILKKSPSIDKQSVNSGTSDLGAIDIFPNKSSLRKDQGASCNQKYNKTVKMLKYQNVKFVDNLFPPGMASLCYSKQRMSEFSNIRWMRLQQVFKHKKLVLFSENISRKCIIQKGFYNNFDNMAITFNSLSNSNRCLHRMMQDQKVFGLCVYYLRINHDGIWKYIIVDDYIPVVKSNKGDVPAFLNVSENAEGEIQIWPFLAQKALAKLYNCYQCLMSDSPQNLIYQFSGAHFETFDLRQETSQFKFRNSVLHTQTIILASNSIDQLNFPKAVYALREDCELNSNTYFNLDIRLRIIDPDQNRNFVADLGEICKIFQTIKICRIDDSLYSLGCIIKQAKNSISLRKFTITRPCPCTLNLIQKDKKYYRNNGYEYIWARLMIMTRDGSNGYRWIAGKYQKQRILTLNCVLEPGQYYIMIEGDWKNRAYQMVLNYQGTQEIQFSRETFDKHPKMIIETCVDLAQRFGNFRQLNRNLCSYRLVDLKNGFIIQNVNNQISRQVFFHKIYSLPKKNENSYQLLERKLYLEEAENEIQILIEPNSHFTFVIKLVDGFKNVQLTNFQF